MSEPDRYVVIGNPIKHSRSPDIHARFARQTGQLISYERLLAPLDGFAQTVQAFIAAGGKGANVTVPFKLDAYDFATELTQRAKAAGAVNTLKIEGPRIVGDNTDGVGLVTDIVKNAGVALRGKRVLLLGAGGAARGAILPILMQQPAEMVIANRTHSKAEELVRHFSGFDPTMRASDFAAIDRKYDVIVNATSASLSAEVPPVPALGFGGQTLAYDMMYAKEPTPFLQYAAQHGAAIRDGLGMLVEQAAESFYIWRGVRPDTAPVYDELRSLL
jgi:shikimate dehydrogenase